MLAGLRVTASLPLRSGSQILYSRAVCATRLRFCCLAPTLKSRYSTRKPDVKDTNRRSKQLDLDLSALRESKNPEQSVETHLSLASHVINISMVTLKILLTDVTTTSLRILLVGVTKPCLNTSMPVGRDWSPPQNSRLSATGAFVGPTAP